MTREEIIRMAEEAGWLMEVEWDETNGFMDLLERFAIVVAKHEREACAVVAERFGWSGECRHVATAIRARGEQP